MARYRPLRRLQLRVGGVREAARDVPAACRDALPGRDSGKGPMSWRGKKVLVTGAGGFIGSHLVELLAGAGAEIRALVRYNSRGTFGWLHDLDREVYRTLDIVCGDLRDADTVLRVVKGCDVVFHLGAMIS